MDERPADVLKVIASILPKDIKVSLETMSDSELGHRIDQLANSLGLELVPRSASHVLPNSDVEGLNDGTLLPWQPAIIRDYCPTGDGYRIDFYVHENIKLDDRPFGTWRRVDRQNRKDDPLTDQINFFRRKLKFLPGSTRIRGIPTTEAQKAEIRRYANATLVPLLDNIIANIRADYRGRQLWRPVKRD